MSKHSRGLFNCNSFFFSLALHSYKRKIRSEMTLGLTWSLLCSEEVKVKEDNDICLSFVLVFWGGRGFPSAPQCWVPHFLAFPPLSPNSKSYTMSPGSSSAHLAQVKGPTWGRGSPRVTCAQGDTGRFWAVPLHCKMIHGCH